MPVETEPQSLFQLTKDDIVPVVYASHVGQLICVASLCLIIWDTLITLDKEVEYIWRRSPRVNLVKAIFVLNRYWVPFSFSIRIYRYLVSNPSGTACSILGLLVYWSQIVNLYVLQAGLAIRVWAIFERSTRIKWLLIFLMTASLIIMVTIYAVNTQAIGRIRHLRYPQLLYGCNQVNYPLPGAYSTIYYPALALEIVFFAMTMFQVIRHRIANEGTPLIYFIGRNSAVFFFLSLLVIGFAVAGSFVLELCSPARDSNVYMAVLSVNGSRLILSIRDRVYNHSPSWHVTTDLKTIPPHRSSGFSGHAA